MYLVRPLLLVGVVALSLAMWASHGPGAAVLTASLPVLVRSYRFPPVEFALAGGLGFVSPSIGVLLAVRATATQLSLMSHPDGWRGGIARIAKTRRQLVEPRSIDDLLATRLTDFETSVDRALELVLAGWATASLSQLARSVRVALRLVTGRRVLEVEDVFGPFLALLARAVSIQVIANLCLLGATFLALKLVDVPALPPPLSVLPGWLVRFILLAVAWAAVRARPPRLITLALSAGLAAWSGQLSVVGAGIACGLVSVAVRAHVERASLRPRAGRLRRRLPLRRRSAWRAARSATEADRGRVAVRILESILDDCDPSSPAAAIAAVWIAEIERRDGHLMAALQRLDSTVRMAMPGKAMDIALLGRAECLAEMGLAHSALEDLDAREAGMDTASHLVRTRALALAGRVDESLLLAGRRAGNTTVAEILRTETVIARARLLAWDDASAAAARLEDWLQLSSGDDEVDPHDDILPQAWLTLGTARFRSGADASSVLGALRRALRGGLDPRDSAVAKVLLAAASSEISQHDTQSATSIELASAAIGELEEARVQLSSGFARAAVLRVDGIAHQAILDMLSRVDDRAPEAARLADFVMESRRRSALSDLMRSPLLQEMASRLQLDEVLDVRGEQDSGSEAALRDRLAQSFDRVIADAYVPPPVDPRRAVPTLGTPTLSFAVHRLDEHRLEAHSVYTSATGARSVHVATSGDRRVLEVLGAHGSTRRQAVNERPYSPTERARWMAVAECLLPPDLVEHLSASPEPLHLAIVPDATLSLISWAALTLADGTRLVDRCATRIVPALHLTRDSPPSIGPLVATLRDDLPGFEVERPWFTQHGAVVVDGKAALIGALGMRPGRAYLAAHGTGTDLTQRLHLADGVITATEALGLPWPPAVVMAACIAAGYEHEAGREPLGFAISLLLAGATSVIGGTAKIESSSAAQILLPTVSVPPGTEAQALRAAQIAHLDRIGRTASPHRWATYACITLQRQT